MEFVFVMVWLIFTMFAIYGLIKRIDKQNERIEALERCVDDLYSITFR